MLKVPWLALGWSDFIKKRVCRFLLNRYLGNFMQKKLTVDQLNIDFYKGTGTVRDIALDCEAINAIFESQGWDFEVISGHIGSVTVNVPWNALMTEDSFVEVKNLVLVLRPKARAKDDGTTMLESMWSSMSSSMQLAQECLEKKNDCEDVVLTASNSMEGLEKFAQTIDNILNRIKAKFIDTEIRLEYLPTGVSTGVALIMNVKNFEYQNEASTDPTDKESSEKTDDKTFLFSTYASHHITIEDITFYTEEFRIGNAQKAPNSPASNDDSQQFFSSTLSSDPYASALSTTDNEMFYNMHERQSSHDSSGEEEEESEENIFRNEKIMFARFLNKQEIRLNMKMSENIEGPKVELQMAIGALTLFMSPRQLHLLLLICDTLVNGENSTPHQSKELQCLPQPVFLEERSNVGGLAGLRGQAWSSADPRDEYFQNTSDVTFNMHNINTLHRVGREDSIFSSNSSMSSSIGSSASQGTARRKRAIEKEQNADISRFNIRLAGIYLILLHDDILLASSENEPLNSTSVAKLKYKAETYFNSVSSYIASCNTSDLGKIGSILNSACDSNHLRLMFSPLILEGEERRTIKGNRTKLTISIARADVQEVLGDLCIPLLEFSRKERTENIPSHPEISVVLEKTFYLVKSSCGKKYQSPRMNIGITLGSVKNEFDISILDRLNAHFTSPFSEFLFKGVSEDFVNDLSPNSQKIVRSKTEIKINTECLKFILRFPIVDLRPLHDNEKIPWWQRNVRTDFLMFQLMDCKVNFTSPSTYDIMANEINIFYNESEKSSVHIGKASSYNESRYYPPTIDYPKIVIEIPSEANLEELNEAYINKQGRTGEDTDSDPTSGESIKINPNKEKESTPFSAKKVCRESDTPHSKENSGEVFDDYDTETLLIPGDTIEMQTFCNSAIDFAKLRIKIYLPVVSLQLKSKHLYEVIYNRLISDLIMWESSVPKIPEVIKNIESSLHGVGMMESMYVPFAMCKSNINFESGSSATASETESDSEAVFYSIHEKNKKKFSPVRNTDYSSTMAFQLDIGQGMVTMYTPVRDTTNHVIPGQLGEFVIKIKEAMVFSVNGYHGNPHLGYLCLQGKNVEIFHCGLLPVPIQNPPLRDIKCVLPAHMKATFYPTPRNSTVQESKGSSDREMLSLAVQIKACPDQGLKRIKVSAGIQLATLKHYNTLPEHSWLTQLMDFFDVVDYPVPGYQPYTVLTELHLHLWDCSVDYRPLYFPIRAVVTLGTFMISSNLATGSVGCTLRFVAEEATLSLAPHPIAIKKPDDNKVLPASELICVLEVGLFEISLRLSEKVTPLFPKLDLRAAIKDVHIRTCADSGGALLELIGYLATDGDLTEKDEEDEVSSELGMPMDEQEVLLVSTSQVSSVPEVTQSQQHHVNTLMAEAMEESVHISSGPSTSKEEIPDQGVEVFFFPDEQSKKFGTGSTQMPSKSREEQIRKLESHKRRCASEDSISLDSTSYQNDEETYVRPYEQVDDAESESINEEMRELLDFETSVMGMQRTLEPEQFDALPQVEMDLGDITKFEHMETPKVTRKVSSDTDDDFCFVAEEEKPCYSQSEVHMAEDPIRIIDNHFTMPSSKPDLLKAPKDFPMAIVRYTLCEASVVWHMYGGHDFSSEEENRKDRAEKDEMSRKMFSTYLPMSDAYKMGVSYSKGSPNVVSLGNPLKLTWKTRGGFGRKHDVLMEINLNKVRFSHETYPTNTEQASRQVLLVTELEIRDRLAISNINKFLYHPTVGIRSKQGSQHMVVIKALHLRPDPSLTTQECCLRISLLPLRLNIDQDSLLFLINFFNELAGGGEINGPNTKQTQVVKAHQPPVMMVELPEAAKELQARKMVADNLTLLLDEEQEQSEKEDTQSETSSDSPIFFRQIIFSPDVPIRLDYQGKRVELSHGPLAGLLMGLGQLQCSEIRLKKINYRHGILGFDKLINFLLQEWLHDIKKKQLPKILGGVGPMYSLVQLFQGIFDLFWLPIEQYQKDGRIVRGLQRGAQSFSARTALAALEITTRIIHLLQLTAETAYDMVSPGPSVRRRVNRKGKRKRIHPPQDIREGMSNAYHIVKDGIGDTAYNIITMATLEHDQKGMVGAVGSVMRQIPPTVVRPLVLATQATSNVLGGVKNQLIPDARIEAKEKWKDDEE